MDHPLFTYRLVIATVGVLVFIGLLMVISSSQVIGAVQMDDPYYFGKRQIFFAGLGLIGGLGLSMLPENAVRGLARPALLLGIVLLVLTLTPLGVQIAGNRNWLAFGADWTQFQPSEFAKVALIVWGADDLSRRRKQLTDLRQWLPYVGITFTLVGLVVFQKDQGTAMIMAAIVMLIMVAAGAPWRLLAVIAAGVAGLGALMVALQPNRMGRIWAFLNPDLDPLGLNMQARRGIYALASGGWFGQGLGASRQKWGLLSEAHTDYIFAIIGEELGAVGALTVIALFAVLAFAGIRIARRSTSVFSRLIAIGVVTWFSVQAFANIAVAVRLFPVMGVTLPMVSYGGSSLMANLFAAGLLAGCARREPQAVKHLASRKRKPRARTIVRTH
jgi:cell division protein FtsW